MSEAEVNQIKCFNALIEYLEQLDNAELPPEENEWRLEAIEIEALQNVLLVQSLGLNSLPEREHARARGATIYAEIIGYGATADASHITLPAPGGIGAVRAAERAMRKAGLEPRDIVHVNAHATSTPEGDKAELQAIRTIFGDHAGSVSVTSNKSMIGHTLGAAGAIEAIITIQTIRASCVPPTINLVDPDPVGEGLDLVAGSARSQDVPIALSNSFGFGGQNTALIFRRWTE
jgi:3-oxoacyl-[acyl-carrier-protein] synthase II